MFTVFNIVLILLVGLIAYWWANQGLFSAILHLICVIAAGAITLGVWEPLTTGLLLRGNRFDDYAWGVSFIGVFVITLLILRVIMDKTVRANVNLPNWANLTFGLPVGALAGILTMGLFLIGAGHIQSGREIMDFAGFARSDRSDKPEHVNRLWAPVHEWTYEFYSLLSVTSLASGQPLRQYSPDLDLQAVSLLRDSAEKGRGKLSLRPGDAKIEKVTFCPDIKKYAVTIRFETGARDFGDQLTLSQSQIRLISAATGTEEPRVAFPESWTQYDGFHRFDDPSHYITSEPGQAQGSAVVFFSAGDFGGKPAKFIQIRGTRYRLPMQPPGLESVTPSDFRGLQGSMTAGGGGETFDASARSIQEAVVQTNDIRPIQASVNQKPGGIELTDKLISGGEGEFITSGGTRPGRGLEIGGIYQTAGTQIVQVDVSRGTSPASIFTDTITALGNALDVYMVDSQGRKYLPIGYIHTKPNNRTVIKVDSINFLGSKDKLPALPSSGDHKLKLLFAITHGATLKALKYGEVTIGTCELLVQDPDRRNEAPAAGGGASGP